ncbi:hypothetical protein SeLEV6574_g06966 [Synchytrium endobioticum]|uniref:protein xylosyltransferase n=1 Tax=Synchytrium endobioticum TaxID=286115 RepID=A0A507CJA9_9FUNG|nr:hypothetical protein SeLEV6574_g06966 [Synchytrium endobioticum]
MRYEPTNGMASGYRGIASWVKLAARPRSVYTSLARLLHLIWISAGIYVVILIRHLQPQPPSHPPVAPYDSMFHQQIPQGMPTAPLYGFQYCSHLDGSTFVLNLTPSFGVSPASPQFPPELDSAAVKYADYLQKKQGAPLDPDSLRRAACYLVASGRSDANSVALLLSVDPSTYFPLVSYTPRPEGTVSSIGHTETEVEQVPRHDRANNSSDTSQNTNSAHSRSPGLGSTQSSNGGRGRSQHQMAYVILTHEFGQFNNIKLILKELAYQHPNTIVMIHVDLNAKELAVMLQNWIDQNFQPWSQHGCILINNHHIRASWGTVNLVLATLDSFFKLLDAADWEYAVLLSTHDWPLMTASGMYESLRASEPNGTHHSWVGAVPNDDAQRWNKPHVISTTGETLQLSGWKFPIAFHETVHWKVYNHPQWVVLARDHVQAFRTDRRLISWLAFCEFVFIPDEIYFGTGLMALDELRRDTYPIRRTFDRFTPGNFHPDTIDFFGRHSLLVSDPPEPESNLYPYLFARKIDISSQPHLRAWIKYKLHHPNPRAPCHAEDVSYRAVCFTEALQNLSSLDPPRLAGNVLKHTISNESTIIPTIIPVNDASKSLAMNLICSLPRKNVLLWALDEVVHDLLIANQFMSYHNQRRFGRKHYEFTWADLGDLHDLGKDKSSFLNMILRQGKLKHGFWVLDADVVLLRDLNGLILSSSGVDVLVMVDRFPGQDKRPIPQVSTGVMYVNNTAGALKIFQYLETHCKTLRDDTVALNQLLNENNIGIQDHDGSWIKLPATDTVPVIKLISEKSIVSGHMLNSHSFDDTASLYAVHANGILEMEEKRKALENAEYVTYKLEQAFETLSQKFANGAHLEEPDMVTIRRIIVNEKNLWSEDTETWPRPYDVIATMYM